MGMSGIDDWYMNYAHRHELTPGFSPDDDIPDPYVPGEVPQREWAVPGSRQRPKTGEGAQRPGAFRDIPSATRGGSWKSAAEKWFTEFPQGTNRECLRALRTAGHKVSGTRKIDPIRASVAKVNQNSKAAQQTRSEPSKETKTASSRRRASAHQRRNGSTVPDWHDFAINWFRNHPAASNRQWRDEVKAAGFTAVTRADISALRPQVEGKGSTKVTTKTKPIRSTPSRRRRVTTSPQQPKLFETRYCDACSLAIDLDGRCRC
jgi:hypothetical protein